MADIPWSDLLEAAGDGFDPAPPGTYKVKVKSAEVRTSTKNNPMIVATLAVVEGPETGKTVTQFITKSKAAASMFFGNMAALGIDPKLIVEKNPTMAQLAGAITGQFATVTVEATDKNQAGVGVKGVLKKPAGGNKPVTVFPVVTDADELGYTGSSAPTVPTVENAAF